MIKKLLLIALLLFNIFIILLLYTSNANAVTVTPAPVIQEVESTGIEKVGEIFGIVLFIIIFGSIFVALAFWIIFTIARKIEEYNRRKKDFIYYDFENNLNQCHINRDPSMKYKRLRSFNLLWTRETVYLKNKQGLQPVGLYQGECSKKENFYFISIYNKLGWFKYVESIIFIPIKLKDTIITKIKTGKHTSLIIEADGLDNIANMDYYMIPLIPDPESPLEYLDFADMIHSKYLEKIVYRDVIKENLQQYREGIIKSVETNPNVQFSRRLDK